MSDAPTDPTAPVPVADPESGAAPAPSWARRNRAWIAAGGAAIVLAAVLVVWALAGDDDGDAARVATAPGSETEKVGPDGATLPSGVPGDPGDAGAAVDAGGAGGAAKGASSGASGSGSAGTPTDTAPGATTTPSGDTTTTTPTATTAAPPTTSGSPVTLNFSLPPVYGSSALTSGFVPDPFTVGVTSGGPANVAYLGGGCAGNTTAAPSFSVNYTSGAFPLLRFYFVGGADTTMIINTPGGSYVCVDDSFGTLNPTIDFNSPTSGRYDVWIASYVADASIPGTLYVTENSGNHP